MTQRTDDDVAAAVQRTRAMARHRAQENYEIAVHSLQLERQLSGREVLEEPLQELDLTHFNLDDELSANWRYAVTFGLAVTHAADVDDLRSRYRSIFEAWLRGAGEFAFEAARDPENDARWYVTKDLLTMFKLTWGGR